MLPIVAALNDPQVNRRLTGTVKLLVSNNDIIGLAEKLDLKDNAVGGFYWSLADQTGVDLVSLQIEGTMLPTEKPIIPNLMLPLTMSIRPRRTDPDVLTQLTIKNVSPEETNVDLTPIDCVGPYEEVSFEDMKTTAISFMMRTLERLQQQKSVIRLDISRSQFVRSLLDITRDIFCQNQCTQLCIDHVSFLDDEQIDTNFIYALIDEWILPTWTADQKFLVVSPLLPNMTLCNLACGYRTKILRPNPLFFFIWHPDHEGIIVVEQDEPNNLTKLTFHKRICGPFDSSFFRYLLRDTL